MITDISVEPPDKPDEPDTTGLTTDEQAEVDLWLAGRYAGCLAEAGHPPGPDPTLPAAIAAVADYAEYFLTEDYRAWLSVSQRKVYVLSPDEP